MSTTYTEIQAQLSWMCPTMIPGNAELKMPSASDVDLINTLLPQALKARPDLARKFYDVVLTLPATPPSDPLAVINAIPATEMEIVARFIAGAYFSSSAVAAALRFPGFQEMHENVDYDEIMKAIEPIVERGPCYVQV